MFRKHLAICILLVLSACGGGSPTVDKPKPKAVTCAPSGTSLKVIAKNIKFDRTCLAAPSDQAFTIELDNQDADTHNLSIYTNKDASEQLFMGKEFAGPKIETYEVEALSAGKYFFRCDFHPEINGPFIVS